MLFEKIKKTLEERERERDTRFVLEIFSNLSCVSHERSREKKIKNQDIRVTYINYLKKARFKRLAGFCKNHFVSADDEVYVDVSINTRAVTSLSVD